MKTYIFVLLTIIFHFIPSKITASQILHESATPVCELQPGVPKEVSSIIDKAMAKADTDRFQSAAEFAIEIKRTMNNLFPYSPIPLFPSTKCTRGIYAGLVNI